MLQLLVVTHDPRPRATSPHRTVSVGPLASSRHESSALPCCGPPTCWPSSGWGPLQCRPCCHSLPACLSPLPYPTCLSASLPYLQEAKRGLGTSAVFIARNRFAVLDRAANTIQIRNLQNEITKKCAPPCATTDAVFYAGTGMLLCRSEDKVGIYTHLPISLMR